MSRCLEVSYTGFRHLWLGSALTGNAGQW